MTTELDPLQTRGELILRSAVEAFGRHGIAGASLRKIARDAGVSLTLISHHFESKQRLVQAGIDRLHRLASGPQARLRQALEVSSGLTLDAVVAAWVEFSTTLFASGSRRNYLRLLLRLQIDSSIDETTAETLDVAAPYVRRALARLFPAARDDTIAFAWNSVSAALYSTLLNDTALSEDGPRRLERLARLRRVLVAGLSAALDPASSDEVR
jgi:AcrR family transcriptional regulator